MLLTDVIGNLKVKKSLSKSLSQQRVPHSKLFLGQEEAEHFRLLLRLQDLSYVKIKLTIIVVTSKQASFNTQTYILFTRFHKPKLLKLRLFLKILLKNGESFY